MTRSAVRLQNQKIIALGCEAKAKVATRIARILVFNLKACFAFKQCSLRFSAKAKIIVGEGGSAHPAREPPMDS